jgi:hypothetical protein
MFCQNTRDFLLKTIEMDIHHSGFGGLNFHSIYLLAFPFLHIFLGTTTIVAMLCTTAAHHVTLSYTTLRFGGRI